MSSPQRLAPRQQVDNNKADEHLQVLRLPHCKLYQWVESDVSGPTVERGLAALESLYELRNTIPELVKATSLPAGKGEFGGRPQLT